MDDEERAWWAEQDALYRPWKVEGKSVAQWIAARPEWHSVEAGERVAEPTHEYRFRGAAVCPPAASGVYLLLDADCRLLYVGKAMHLAYRLGTHWQEGRIPFARVRWIETPDDVAAVLEAYLIDKLAPPMNRRFDGGMERMCDQVKAALAELESAK